MLLDKIKNSDSFYLDNNPNCAGELKRKYIIPTPEVNNGKQLGILVRKIHSQRIHSQSSSYRELSLVEVLDPNQDYDAGLYKDVEYITSDLDLEDKIKEYEPEIKSYLPESLLE